ncbi:MAG: iron ABC transporter permease [Candidatus Brocadiales bacterium]|nr:iron ABC transporter permease [Candidatus Bathyanammoxibius amoris]
MVDRRPSFSSYKEVFTDYKTGLFFLNSLLLAFLTTTLSTILGIFTGFLFGKTDLPFKGIYRILFLVPFIIPSYIYGLAWADLLGKTGLLNNLISGIPFVTADMISSFMYSAFGGAMVLGLSFFPVIMLIAEGSFSRVGTHMEESGLIFEGRGRVITKVLLPLAAPGIFSGMLIVFILTLSEFGVPFLLDIKVLTTQIFTQFSAFYNEKAAVALSIPLVCVTVSLMVVERIYLKGRSFEALGRGTNTRTYKYLLGRWKIPCVIACCLILAVVVVFPLVTLVMDSWSLDAYKKAFLLTRQSIMNTLVFGVVGASLITLLGLAIGYFSEKARIYIGKGMEFSMVMLFAIPGTVIGVGLIRLWNRPDGFSQFVYGSFIIIIIGYVARFAPIAARTMADSYRQVPNNLVDAAEVAGAGWWRLKGKILIPLVGSGIMITWLLSFIFCVGEIGTTILVYPPGQETLPIALFTVMANSPTNVVAAVSVLLVVIVLVPVGMFLGIIHLVRTRLCWF